MRTLIACTCLLALVGCTMSSPERAEKPAFKGMELYSWKPADKDWQFSLLPGTNRLKEESEITKPDHTLDGVGRLQEALAVLAPGEQVFWRNRAAEPCPPDLVKEIETFCVQKDIVLVGP